MVNNPFSHHRRAWLLNSSTLQIEYDTNPKNSLDKSPYVKKIFLKNKTPIEFFEEVFEKHEFGQYYCYFSHENDIIFTLPAKDIEKANTSTKFFLACEMSGWENANQSEEWALREILVNGNKLLGLRLDKDLLHESFQFKFVSDKEKWVSPNDDTPNQQTSKTGVSNFVFHPKTTGDNIVQYHLKNKISLRDKLIVEFSDNLLLTADTEPWISSLYSDIQLGASIFEDSSSFRIFAPRAINVRVLIFNRVNSKPVYYYLKQTNDGIWHTEILKSLHKKYYYYQMLFDDNDQWEKAENILDPYAKATVSSKGPGIILHDKIFNKLKDPFVIPAIQDLIIVEAHIRDLLTKAQIILILNNRLYFSGLIKLLRKGRSYLSKLGVNCVELQPIQEFDYKEKTEYHWGYMPANWFSPSSAYSRSLPGNQVKTFKKLVKAFHTSGMAVILDVVYNHFGDSGHLQNIDQKYYFRHNHNGSLTNFSGCGNDLRTENHMVRKLIIDSLEHLIKTYNVDGFRFDLAELLGMDFLDILQKRLKYLNPSIILIAEPWSFRGHIGVEMQSLPYSVWNDEYRDFVKDYILERGNADGLKYFLCGGLDFRSKFPSQSVNYIASHDDRGWVDNITENPHNDGSAPTENDRRRTHLSAAILMMSIGIPMMTAGQDFLFSKRGANNTYNRGELNALNYNLLKKNQHTHNYFSQLIKFRLSKLGQVFRLADVPNKTYFRFFPSSTNSACALIYNEDKTFPLPKIIFAVNPHLCESAIDFKNFELNQYRVLANEEEFFISPIKLSDKIIEGKLILPPLSCRIYTEENII